MNHPSMYFPEAKLFIESFPYYLGVARKCHSICCRYRNGWYAATNGASNNFAKKRFTPLLWHQTKRSNFLLIGCMITRVPEILQKWIRHNDNRKKERPGSKQSFNLFTDYDGIIRYPSFGLALLFARLPGFPLHYFETVERYYKLERRTKKHI